jgi:hypothetical protein
VALGRLRRGCDIAVCDGPAGRAVLDLVRGLERERRPRLVIWLLDPLETLPRIVSPPDGTALLVLPAQVDAPGFVRDFLYGLIHDYPLHEAFKAALRGSGLTYAAPGFSAAGPPWLVADPLTNQGLRMADAYESLTQEASQLARGVQLGQIRELLEGVPEEEAGLHGFVFEGLRRAESRWPEVEELVRNRRIPTFSFNQEVEGLVPLAAAKHRIEMARAAHAEVEEGLREVTRDPMAVDEIARKQDRRVEVEMDIVVAGDDGTLFYRPAEPERDRALAPGQGCRVRVYVGAPSARSIVEGEVPPIDPLLPETDDDGHDLDIVFFEKDFELRSARLQRVRLPRLGGTPPVEFELRAPERTGTAHGRIMVFHENQLLQSFLLTVSVTEYAEVFDDSEIRVGLEWGRSARFTNLDALGERAISMGFNQDPDGSHTLFVKKGDAAPAPVLLPELAVDDWTRRFREILERYAWNEGRTGPGFDFRLEGAAAPGPRFAAAIRELATLGGGIHTQLFQRRGTGLGPLLRNLRKQGDRALQIARHDPNFAFPWSIVYDFPLPKEISGRPPAPVCVGEAFDDGITATPSSRRGCPHNPGRDVYCVEGFWGVRHRLEQLMPNGRRADETIVVRGEADRPGVRLALSIRTDDVENLDTGLHQALSSAVGGLGADEDLLDLLWDESRRPLALVILGHLAVKAVDGEPAGERILLFPRETLPADIPPDLWLQPNDIVQRTKDDYPMVGDPAPLVFLMACDSGATEIAELTGFVTSLADAGAGAVIGTESTVFASLASRFAREVILELWEGERTLGEAVQTFNRRLLRAGIPVPFAFSAVGNTDLRIEVTP